MTRGRHLVYVRGRDANGFWGPVSAAFVTLLDSSTLTGAVVVSGTTTLLLWREDYGGQRRAPLRDPD